MDANEWMRNECLYKSTYTQYVPLTFICKLVHMHQKKIALEIAAKCCKVMANRDGREGGFQVSCWVRIVVSFRVRFGIVLSALLLFFHILTMLKNSHHLENFLSSWK